MTSKINHFLLVFDHKIGKLVTEQHFGTDGKTALTAYSAMEKDHQDNNMIEIVLIGSDSIETVKLTHANYYNGSVAVSKYLAGI